MMAEVPGRWSASGTIFNPADFTRVEKLGVKFGIARALDPHSEGAADSALRSATGIAPSPSWMMAWRTALTWPTFPGPAGRRHQGLRALGGVPECTVLPDGRP